MNMKDLRKTLRDIGKGMAGIDRHSIKELARERTESDGILLGEYGNDKEWNLAITIDGYPPITIYYDGGLRIANYYLLCT